MQKENKHTDDYLHLVPWGMSGDVSVEVVWGSWLALPTGSFKVWPLTQVSTQYLFFKGQAYILHKPGLFFGHKTQDSRINKEKCR